MGPVTTPDPDAHPRPWVRVRRSARARLAAASVLLVVVAVLASLLVSRQLLLIRLSERVDRELAAEIAELRTLALEGVDPRRADGSPTSER